MATEGSSGSHLDTSKGIHIYTNLNEKTLRCKFDGKSDKNAPKEKSTRLLLRDKSVFDGYPRNIIDLQELDREIFPSQLKMIFIGRLKPMNNFQNT